MLLLFFFTKPVLHLYKHNSCASIGGLSDLIDSMRFCKRVYYETKLVLNCRQNTGWLADVSYRQSICSIELYLGDVLYNFSQRKNFFIFCVYPNFFLCSSLAFCSIVPFVPKPKVLARWTTTILLLWLLLLYHRFAQRFTCNKQML